MVNTYYDDYKRTLDELSHYKKTLDELLCKLDILDNVLSCSNLFCELHTSFISSLHEHIVSSLVTAAQESIYFHSAIF